MSMEPLIGEIQLYPYPNLVPKGWALCDGSLLSISQNTALYSILGTTYGGDGIRTFALPDLRGRVAVQQGNGIALGNTGGGEVHTLTLNEMPAHTHNVSAGAQAPTQASPTGNVWATDMHRPPLSMYGIAPDGHLDASAVSYTGGGQPHTNLQPYLVLNYYIATLGTYPVRP